MNILPGETKKSASVGVTSGGYTLTLSLGFILAIIFSYGAAKLSYDRFRSVGWAALAFVFSSIYYPYYAIFLNQAAPVAAPMMLGARRR